MALPIELCRILRSTEYNLAQGASLTEGKAAVATYENGVLAVKPSTGAAGEAFMGVMLNEPSSPGVQPGVFPITTDDASKATLPYVPVAGSVAIPGYTEVNAAPGAATEFRVVDNVVQFQNVAANKNKQLNATMKYTMGNFEATARFGDSYPGGSAAQQFSLTGVAEEGEIYTDQWDTDADWSGTLTVLYMGADGQFTTNTTGAQKVPNAVITKFPVAGSAYLGFRL